MGFNLTHLYDSFIILALSNRQGQIQRKLETQSYGPKIKR